MISAARAPTPAEITQATVTARPAEVRTIPIPGSFLMTRLNAHLSIASGDVWRRIVSPAGKKGDSGCAARRAAA
jgi:hypothetical protein